MRALAVSAIVSLGVAPVALAESALFRFEDAPSGSATSLTVTDAGLSMTIHRVNARPFQVLDSADYPASWGSHAIAPFGLATTDPFILNFSAPVTRVTFETGDFGADSDLMETFAFSGLDATGSTVDAGTYYYTEQMSLPHDVWTFELVAAGDQGIRSIWFDSMDAGADVSIVFDNVRVTFVPAPGTAVLSLVPLALLRRRRY